MQAYCTENKRLFAYFSTGESRGLGGQTVEENRRKYGKNTLSKRKKQSLFSRVVKNLTEPLMIILLIAFAVTLGSELGVFFRTGEADFFESAGILVSIVLSTAITLIMEGKSSRAFEMIGKMEHSKAQAALRNGKRVFLDRAELVAGDVIFLENGDKIPADGKILASDGLKCDESSLTGESVPVKKECVEILGEKTPLAERKNTVYAGTFVSAGRAKVLVTAVGDGTEIGRIAGELSLSKEKVTPLQEKLTALGKRVSVFGCVSAAVVLLISVVQLAVKGTLNFSSVQSAVISSIVLLVAAVPEGLPTIVALSLALSVMKMAKENALVKKMIACETAGLVTVICSDKTGTLTENKMRVVRVCTDELCTDRSAAELAPLLDNIVLNTTASVGKEDHGSATECALLRYAAAAGRKIDEERAAHSVTERVEFRSEYKYMATKTGETCYFKGAPEVILAACALSESVKAATVKQISEYQAKSGRVLCFARGKSTALSDLTYDGFAVLADPLRKDVKRAVKQAQRAHISVKMLTGDHPQTAYAIGKELGIVSSPTEVVTAASVEKMTDEQLKKSLPRLKVVARSTPAVKKRLVSLLKESGEVVAVTGDGINDAPAIRAADYGVAMGITGSDVAKESADVVLLNDSFSTIIRSVCYGRTINLNFRKFILFQLSVNCSAVACIVFSLIRGVAAPFNALQLLWINLIMDGPPALSLGLGGADERLMEDKPEGRTASLVTKKMWIRIALSAAVCCTLFFLQEVFNFLCVKEAERSTVLFTMFIMLNLANAMNCREAGSRSVFGGLKNNKTMYLILLATLFLQIVIVEYLGVAFKTEPLALSTWLKLFAVSLVPVLVSECYKAVYRRLQKRGVRFLHEKG